MQRSSGGNCCLFGDLSHHLGTYLLVGLTHPCHRNIEALFAVIVLMVLVLNLGVWSRFLTNNFADNNVLICGLNVIAVVIVSKSFVYSGLLGGVSNVGQTDLWWLVG